MSEKGRPNKHRNLKRDVRAKLNVPSLHALFVALVAGYVVYWIWHLPLDLFDRAYYVLTVGLLCFSIFLWFEDQPEEPHF